jgi:hypothetical protein
MNLAIILSKDHNVFAIDYEESWKRQNIFDPGTLRTREFKNVSRVIFRSIDVLKQLVRELKLEDSVILTGFQPYEMMPQYMKAVIQDEERGVAQEEKVKEALAVVLTERQERAIEYLRENIFITTRVYASLVDVSERQARYDLNDLVEKNLIVAEGATTTRKYHLRQTSADFGKLRSKKGEK